MKAKQKICMGWDNGNGTSIASAEVGNNIYECFFPSVYGLGLKGREFIKAEQTKTIDPNLNGNAVNFNTTVSGVKVWGGQTAYTVRSNPVDLHGISRYDDDLFMKYMYCLTLQGLVNDGMKLARDNRLSLTVGMPPEIFYETPDEAEFIKGCFKKLLRPGDNYVSAKTCYEDQLCTFTVDKLNFTAEGAGAYYDTIINDDLSVTEKAASYANDGVLIIDVGRYTFDAFILLDNRLGEEKVYTGKEYGLESFFSIINEELDGVNIPVKEIERQNYSKSSRNSKLRSDDYAEVYSRSMDRYVSSLSTPLSYFKELSSYANILIVGGIVDLFDDEKVLKRMFSIRDCDTTLLGTRSNARGYRKFSKIIELAGNG